MISNYQRNTVPAGGNVFLPFRKKQISPRVEEEIAPRTQIRCVNLHGRMKNVPFAMKCPGENDDTFDYGHAGVVNGLLRIAILTYRFEFHFMPTPWCCRGIFYGYQRNIIESTTRLSSRSEINERQGQRVLSDLNQKCVERLGKRSCRSKGLSDKHHSSHQRNGIPRQAAG
ncbi:hypothetical protein TNCV_597221 [Trichonephila clavipes]|nr:hypothetical protein TNCV_597221 [Trichonephila clavipes]